MILLESPTDWPSVRKQLDNVTEFMNKLLTYDVEATPEEVWKEVGR